MPCLASLAALLFAATARAAPLRKPHFVKLEYVRGPGAVTGCPSETMMQHAILARLDEDPFSDTAKATLRVNIVREGEAFQASYELCDEVGECVQGPPIPPRIACINAVESVAFSVGIFMPSLLTGSTPPRKEPPPSPPPPARDETPPPARDETPRQRQRSTKFARPFRWRVDGGGLLNVGLASGLRAGGFSAHVAVRWPSASVSLGPRYEFFTNNGEDTQLSVSRVLGEVVPCFHTAGFLLPSVAVCGLVQFGEETVKFPWGQGLVPTTYSWFNLWTGFRFVGEWILPRPVPPNISLHLYADLTASLRRINAISPKPSIWSAAIGGSVAYLF